MAVQAFLTLTLLTSAAQAADGVEQENHTKAAKRASLRTYHRSFGITTWISLGATNVIGTMRYANVIGFGEPLCSGGNSPLLGRSWGCGDGLRYQHLVSATFTTASYVTTRTLAALMPDPYHVAAGASAHARKLKIHRALSWVHLGGMAAMPVLGLATSMTSDTGKRRTLATTHLAIGWSTFAVLSAAALVWVF